MTSTVSQASTIDFTIPDPSDPSYASFASIFAHFNEQAEGEGGDSTLYGGTNKPEVYWSDEEDEDDEENKAKAAARAADEEGLTRRQKRAAAVSLQFWIDVNSTILMSRN